MIRRRSMDRRDFLLNASRMAAGSVAAGAISGPLLHAAALLSPAQTKPDYTLKIQPTSLEIAPGVTIKTTAYTGQVPGPFWRLKERVPVTIDVTNASDHPDLVHWHGLAIDSLNDGAMEEWSPMIAPGG